MLDRVEPMAFAKPCNYGFIPQTLDEDGDELDVLMITEQPLTTGIYVQARILGVMKFVDDDEVDDKIIAVPADDRNNGNAIQTLEDLPDQLMKQIEFHFNHYKDLKKRARPWLKVLKVLTKRRRLSLMPSPAGTNNKIPAKKGRSENLPLALCNFILLN